MGRYKTYSQTIFGRKGNAFEGVDQNFDPASEPMGRVQYSMDVDYTREIIKTREGYTQVNEYPYASVLSIQNVPFPEVGSSVAVMTGNGDVYRISDLT